MTLSSSSRSTILLSPAPARSSALSRSSSTMASLRATQTKLIGNLDKAYGKPRQSLRATQTKLNGNLDKAHGKLGKLIGKVDKAYCQTRQSLGSPRQSLQATTQTNKEKIYSSILYCVKFIQRLKEIERCTKNQ